MLPVYLVALLAASTSAHTIFQRVKVDGKDQGQGVGVRIAGSNNPVENVDSSDIICNKGSGSASKVIEVAAGASITTVWGHVIGGPQSSDDKENPIASSHHGPILTYLAKVDSAAKAGASGQKWFKIQEEGMASDGTWAVDKLYKSGGTYSFNLPSCIAPGEYLMRHEIIALHNAYDQGKAQFYMGCAQIKVTKGGSYKPANTVSFPGAYKATDAGIKVNIYGEGGKPNNGGKAYQIPGPAVMKC